jgi:phosphoglycolate phosphatase-like HAD superfamily hydrolase
MARDHLVWDWNGTLLDDTHLVVTATNRAFAVAGGPVITVDEHRRGFKRPIAEYYGEVLGRAVDHAEFERLDEIFHDAYRVGLTTCALAADATAAIKAWPGTQSLLSMWFHAELVPAVETYGLAGLFARVDGRPPAAVPGGLKAGHLAAHLRELGIQGERTVLIGDSLDDAAAAASVGGRCVLYTGGITAPATLRASGHPVADTLLDAVRLAARL